MHPLGRRPHAVSAPNLSVGAVGHQPITGWTRAITGWTRERFPVRPCRNPHLSEIIMRVVDIRSADVKFMSRTHPGNGARVPN